MNKIIIPIIKNIAPTLTLTDVVGCPPMMTSVNTVFKMKIAHGEPEYKEGDRRHSFLDGFQTFYHGEWINDSLWWKLKQKGL